jgi:hypothetical protein
MDCTTARSIYVDGPEHYIGHVQKLFPEAYQRLAELAEKTVNGTGDHPFHKKVVEMVGKGPYYLEHGDDHDPVFKQVHELLSDLTGMELIGNHFSGIHNTELSFSNICCSSCKCVMGKIPIDQIIRIQYAAVQIEPDGSVWNV